uniref:Uncharacterized protein n=1 Tax=viral metagenome TaxID=1070528 RepID=A0A6C0L960_9ZZZZ
MPCNKINVPDCDNISTDKINKINVLIKNVLDAPEKKPEVTPEVTPEENVNDDKEGPVQNEKPTETSGPLFKNKESLALAQSAWDRKSRSRKFIDAIQFKHHKGELGRVNVNLFKPQDKTKRLPGLLGLASDSHGGKRTRIRRKRSKKTRKGRSRKHKK